MRNARIGYLSQNYMATYEIYLRTTEAIEMEWN